jgi:hypothetical protein
MNDNDSVKTDNASLKSGLGTALDKLQKLHPTAIFIPTNDIQSPVTKGLDLEQLWLARHSGVPIVQTVMQECNLRSAPLKLTPLAIDAINHVDSELKRVESTSNYGASFRLLREETYQAIHGHLSNSLKQLTLKHDVTLTNVEKSVASSRIADTTLLTAADTPSNKSLADHPNPVLPKSNPYLR